MVMAAWFIEQPLPAKKMYWMMVMAREATYMPSVDPIKTKRQNRESSPRSGRGSTRPRCAPGQRAG